MEIRELQNAMLDAATPAKGVTAAALYPSGANAGALVAVDVWELQPGASLTARANPEEQIIYVLEGEGRFSGEGDGGATVHVRPNTCVYVAPGERLSLANSGRDVLRLLVTTPMLVRSSRATGINSGGRLGSAESDTRSEAASPRAEEKAADPSPAPSPEAAEEGSPAPVNIDGMMRKASELRGQPRPERRRPPEPPPVEEPPAPDTQAEPDDDDEEEDEANNLMELLVAFDAGTRGSPDAPGEGFGRYLVQAPGRPPATRRAELGDDFTPLQAEYRVLIECLNYVVSRLQATGRSPEGVRLDIRSKSEQAVNQLLGTMKIKEAALRKDNAEATALLEQFADWRIEWAPEEEIVRLFGG